MNTQTATPAATSTDAPCADVPYIVLRCTINGRANQVSHITTQAKDVPGMKRDIRKAYGAGAAPVTVTEYPASAAAAIIAEYRAQLDAVKRDVKAMWGLA